MAYRGIERIVVKFCTTIFDAAFVIFMPDLYISWSEYHQKIEQLAVKIYQNNWDFNQIVCIAKGGLRIGDTMCRLYRKPLAILCASSYSGPENRVRGKISFSSHLAMTTEKIGDDSEARLRDRILLLDDLVDSGVSLRESINWLYRRYPNDIAEIRTGVIWYKACSEISPDYYVDYLPDNPWIHQPFERYEQINPAELAAMHEPVALGE